MRWTLSSFLVLSLAACDCGDGGGAYPDAGVDAGRARDAGVDAGRARDAGVDAGRARDAGPSDSGGAGLDAGEDGGLPPFDAGPRPSFDAGPDAGAAGQAYVECRAVYDMVCAGSYRCCPHTVGRAGPCDGSDPYDFHGTCSNIASMVAAGDVTWDSEAARAEYEQLRLAAESCDAVDVLYAPKGLIEGTLGEGADCTPADLTLDAIDHANFKCATDLYCQILGTTADWTGTCVSLGQEGDPCFDPDECRPELYCDHSMVAEGAPGGGHCSSRAAVGESCSSTLQCLTDHCLDGLCAEPTDAETWCAGGAPR